MLTMFTDGSAVRGNPGQAAGAYAILREGKLLEALGIPLGNGTNNEGELMAVIAGMIAAQSYIEKEEALLVVSDSRYIINGMSDLGHYTESRTRPNWALWVLLSSTMAVLTDNGTEVKCYWVKGHDTNEGNKVCDKLARKTARTQQFQMYGRDRPKT